MINTYMQGVYFYYSLKYVLKYLNLFLQICIIQVVDESEGQFVLILSYDIRKYTKKIASLCIVKSHVTINVSANLGILKRILSKYVKKITLLKNNTSLKPYIYKIITQVCKSKERSYSYNNI